MVNWIRLEKAPRMKGHKIPAWQREWYKTVGGTPQLDQNYTVYGEVVIGIDMVDRIAAVKKDERDRPLEDVPMTVELLSKKECKQLDKITWIPGISNSNSISIRNRTLINPKLNIRNSKS